MEIRELKAKDAKTWAGMLVKLSTGTKGQLVKILSRQDAKSMSRAEIADTGVTIVQVVSADLTEDIYNWLADLIGVEPKDLDEMPLLTLKEIALELWDRGNLRDFFSGLLSSETTPEQDSVPTT